MTPTTLPPQFTELESLVDEWALQNEKDRVYKRLSIDMPTAKAFYAKVLPHMEQMIEYLNGFDNDPDALPKDALRLFQLGAMFMELAAPIDLEWDSTDIEDVFPIERLNFHPPSVAQ